MRRWCGKLPEWMCLSPGMGRWVGNVLAVIGGAFILIFVPLRYWMALLGLILLLVGLIIRICN